MCHTDLYPSRIVLVLDTRTVSTTKLPTLYCTTVVYEYNHVSHYFSFSIEYLVFMIFDNYVNPINHIYFIKS